MFKVRLGNNWNIWNRDYQCWREAFGKDNSWIFERSDQANQCYNALEMDENIQTKKPL